jgi:hypothetical protein
LVASPPQNASAADPAALISYRDTFTREMCRGGGAWLTCFQLDPRRCVNLTSPIVEGCARSIVQNTAKPSVDKVAIQDTSDQIVLCVERIFRQRYENKKLNTQECRDF